MAIPAKDYVAASGDSLECDKLPARTIVEIKLRTRLTGA
jgi:hypothetical protein